MHAGYCDGISSLRSFGEKKPPLSTSMWKSNGPKNLTSCIKAVLTGWIKHQTQSVFSQTDSVFSEGPLRWDKNQTQPPSVVSSNRFLCLCLFVPVPGISEVDVKVLYLFPSNVWVHLSIYFIGIDFSSDILAFSCRPLFFFVFRTFDRSIDYRLCDCKCDKLQMNCSLGIDHGVWGDIILTGQAVSHTRKHPHHDVESKNIVSSMMEV